MSDLSSQRGQRTLSGRCHQSRFYERPSLARDRPVAGERKFRKEGGCDGMRAPPAGLRPQLQCCGRFRQLPMSPQKLPV